MYFLLDPAGWEALQTLHLEQYLTSMHCIEEHLHQEGGGTMCDCEKKKQWQIPANADAVVIPLIKCQRNNLPSDRWSGTLR